MQFPHNYNYVSRAVMYSWFNKHLKLGLKEPIVEEDYQAAVDRRNDGLGRHSIRSRRRATITNAACCARSRPTRDRQLAALMPHDAASLDNVSPGRGRGRGRAHRPRLARGRRHRARKNRRARPRRLPGVWLAAAVSEAGRGAAGGLSAAQAMEQAGCDLGRRARQGVAVRAPAAG